MRIAIVSDIHSNFAALDAVVNDAQCHQVEEYWCLGDTVGYGPDPIECVAFVRDKVAQALSGNHDLGAIGKLGLEGFNPYAAAANKWTNEVLTDSERSFLDSLPTKRTCGESTLVHGGLNDHVWEYVVSTSSASDTFVNLETKLCFVGHSHVPLISFEPVSGLDVKLYALPSDKWIRLGTCKSLVNPGSVGQPRDGDPRAAYIVYDSDEASVLHRRVAYDIAATQDRMRKIGLPEYLVNRLDRGH